MRVAIDVSPALYGTGVSDYIVNLVSYLPSSSLFGYSFRRQSELHKLFPSALVFPFPPSLMHYLWNKLHILSVENLTGKIDVYHSSDWAQAPSKAKKVTTIHDLTPFMFPTETSPQIVAVHKARMRWIVKECHRIICISQNTASDMAKLFPQTSSRLIVIPEAAPSRLLLKPQPLNIGSFAVAIGARQPRKNIARLVSAYTRFRDQLHLPEKLVIVGENDSLASDPSIIFTGYISDQDLVNYLANAQVFVYPSLYEGFGLPILGAFHHKVPVACSNASSFPEVAGSGATFFNPLDEESMAKGIADAIKNKSKLISLGSQQLKKFSWQKAATETTKVYESLINK